MRYWVCIHTLAADYDIEQTFLVSTMHNRARTFEDFGDVHALSRSKKYCSQIRVDRFPPSEGDLFTNFKEYMAESQGAPI